MIDDRFFVGRRDAILQFSRVILDFSDLAAASTNSPERVLFQFARRHGFSVGPAATLYELKAFVVNDEKYTLGFRGALEGQLGRRPTSPTKSLGPEERKGACSHIKTPLAYNRCVGLEKAPAGERPTTSRRTKNPPHQKLQDKT